MLGISFLREKGRRSRTTVPSTVNTRDSAFFIRTTSRASRASRTVPPVDRCRLRAEGLRTARFGPVGEEISVLFGSDWFFLVIFGSG